MGSVRMTEVDMIDIESEIKNALEDFLEERVADFEIQGDKFLVYLKEEPSEESA